MKLKSLPLLASARARAPGSFYLTAAHKLEHDADQLELLLARGKLPAAFGALRDRLRALRAELLGDGARAGDAALVGYRLLTSAQLRATWGAHNALVHDGLDAAAATALAPRADGGGGGGGGGALAEASAPAWAAVDDDYVAQAARGRAPVVVVDRVLAPATLAALCERARARAGRAASRGDGSRGEEAEARVSFLPRREKNRFRLSRKRRG